MTKKKLTFQRTIFLQPVALFKKTTHFSEKKLKENKKSKIFCMLKKERRNLEGFLPQNNS